MAIETDNALLAKLVSQEEANLEAKRKETEKPEWLPAGGEDHGSGVITEDSWLKYKGGANG